ncbi:cation-translocating P-type ATPase [candidate division KSB1 bacterium]|nr:cation-translocating P-type ATPase [candidate division KSB1 bacterium]
MQTWHTQQIDFICSNLQVNPREGLSSLEARVRLDHYGPNELIEQGKRKAWRILLSQFTSLLVIILIIAAVISGVLGKITETSAIMAIVILFAILGFIQEYRAERAMAALRNMTVPLIRVKRDDEIIEILTKHLVPGDIVYLESGNIVPADLRLIEANNLRIQESALTGESESVDKEIHVIENKDIPLGDRHNLAYMGTIVSYGRGQGVVVATGMKTELGKIASLIQGVQSETTPLQERLDQVGKTLALCGIIVSIVIMIIGILYGVGVSDMFLTAVSVAVAVVPEGLPAVMTVTLALGAQRMLRRNSLIRKLHAVETLGSVTVICSDKTGTLTENKMTLMFVDVADHMTEIEELKKHFSVNHSIDVCDSFDFLKKPIALCVALTGGVLCNDASLKYQPDSNLHKTIGDPTEGALLIAASNAGFQIEAIRGSFPRIAELPFDSDRKCMTTVHRFDASTDGTHDMPDSLKNLIDRFKILDTQYISITKGASANLLENATHIMINEHIEPITEKWRQRIDDAHDKLAQDGMRVLGIACKLLNDVPNKYELRKLESNLIFVGLFGMIDPPRPEVKQAVQTCKTAGIRPIMITGDHPLTARFIAYDLGITTNADIITGQQLNLMSESELKQAISHVSIFARVSPEHKLRIVDALKDLGEIVAMTGDGVNDSPALKKADIGIAMGISGTDVAKQASDMVLLDDNFSSIVAAVEEGRTIFDNIVRFIKFSIAGNIGKVLVMLLAPFFGISVALMPLQLLWLNLLTDGLLGFGLGLEPAERNIMQKKPRAPHTSIFANGVGAQIIRIGLFIGILSLALGLYYYKTDLANDNTWQTIIFTSLAFMQIGQALGSRSFQRRFFSINIKTNPAIFIMIVLTIVLQLMAIYAPFLSKFFNVTPLSIKELLICVFMSAITHLYVKFEKYHYYKTRETSR